MNRTIKPSKTVVAEVIVYRYSSLGLLRFKKWTNTNISTYIIIFNILNPISLSLFTFILSLQKLILYKFHIDTSLIFLLWLCTYELIVRYNITLEIVVN